MTTFPSEIILYYDGLVPSVNRWLEPALIKKKINGRIKNIPIVKTAALYNSNKKRMAVVFKEQAAGRFFDRAVDIIYYFNAPRKYDSDNFQKCTQDALELAGIIPNDNLIRNIMVYRYYEPNKHELMIHIMNVISKNPPWPSGDDFISV